MSSENWTQTPNAIYAVMSDMSEAELKTTLALVRATYGYHRPACKLEYSDLMAATGLGRTAVYHGLKAALDRGFFARGDGRSEYVIAAKSSESERFAAAKRSDSEPFEGVKSSESELSSQSELLKSSESEPFEGVKSSESEPFQSNKERERKKGGKPPTPPAAEFPFRPNPSRPARPSPAAERLAAIIDVCNLNADVPAHRRKAEHAAAQLRQYSADYIRHRYEHTDAPNGVWYWYRDDWRGARGEMPTPRTVVETIALERKAPAADRPSGGMSRNEIIAAAIEEIDF